MTDKDEVKHPNLEKPLVSIITVVYNSSLFIEKTVESIINQTSSNFEYIIVDGGSTDGTIDIIKKYDEFISKWISEPDKGLYDAMNKGIKMAAGDYLWFINSGDRIFSETVLLDVFQNLDSLPDLFYGETEIIDYKGQPVGMRRHSVPEKLTWKSLRYGMKVCHQSVIVKRSLAEEYDLNYKYSSDFEWLIRILKKTEHIHHSGIILSQFMQGGQTSKTLIPGLKERFRIMVKHFGFLPTVLRHIILAFKLAAYYLQYRRI